ncbi:hypothetical protein [Sandarakinorhabdus sp. DWP1-3-1]|uniref:hypothetical protein n=1 Tax=Sandarakinorhabdus sp. DWP1-3-1 TaxID=2804627 RepID=UPI003CED0A7F
MRRAEESDLLPAAAFRRGVLALDLSSATGWAFARPGCIADWPVTRPFNDLAMIEPDPRPLPEVGFGTWELGRGLHGRRFDALSQMLRAHAAPGLVVIEQAIPGKFSRTNAATEIAQGLRAVVCGWAANRGVVLREAPINSVKAWFGSPMQRDKAPMIAMAKRLGFDVKSDHEADALAILDLTLARGAMAARLMGRLAA